MYLPIWIPHLRQSGMISVVRRKLITSCSSVFTTKKFHLLVKLLIFSVVDQHRFDGDSDRLSILNAIQIRIRIWIRILPQYYTFWNIRNLFDFLFAAVQVYIV